MKINLEKRAPTRLHRILKSLTNAGNFRSWILGLVVLGAIALTFLAVIRYGFDLQKNHVTGYYKHALVQIANLDFSFIKNYAVGNSSEMDDIVIDIKFKHIQRLQYLREQARHNGMITDVHKNEEFPAKLTFNGVTHSVKISLTGMMTVHLENDDKWSFQVKVKGDNTIEGMKRFGLLLPETRGYITDWVGMELMKERGLMGLRVDFVNVTINGKPKGIFYMEERFDKHLVENNSNREGIIFKIEKEIAPYKESKLMADPIARGQLLMIRRMWQDVLAGKMELGKFIDLEKVAQAFAITDLINNRHALYRFNLRFYFNPVTGLAEPILREWGSMHKNDPDEWSIILQHPRKPGTQRAKLDRDKILKMFYYDIDFKRFYLREANVISQPEFLDKFLAKNKEKLKQLVSKVYIDWPFYKLPTHFLYENQKFIREAISPDPNHIIAYFKKQRDSKLNIQIRNAKDLPVEIQYLSWRDSIYFYPDQSIVLDGEHTISKTNIQTYPFNIPPDIVWADSLVDELQITYNLLGLNDRETILVFPWSQENWLAHSWNPMPRDGNHTFFEFVVKTGDVITIPKGRWTLAKDLVIPPEHQLIVEAGAEIDLIKQAKIISYSPVYLMGTEQESVRVYSSDQTGEGLLIIKAKDRSSVEYTSFGNLSCPTEEGWRLSGAIVFYESPVDIVATTFANNRMGDDYLNIVRSDFTIDHTLFKNVRADAFDCDFCTGSVTNTTFVDIGNDAIDVSGADIYVSHVFMNRIGNNGLSAGEGSSMTTNWVEVTNSEIGLTSKDRSKLIVSDCKLTNTRVGITIFEKRSEYGAAYVQADRLKITGAELPYLVEAKSSFLLEGEPFNPNYDNVEEILYGTEFGKAGPR